MSNLKNDINYIFKNIKDNNDLLKCYFLKKIINMNYFGNIYENIVLVETEEQKYKLMKLNENKALGFTNEIFGSCFIGYNKEDDYESQFVYYEDVKKIFLKDKDYNLIINFFDKLIKTKNFNDFKKKLNEDVNDSIILLKQFSMSSRYNSNSIENDIEKLVLFFEKIIYNDSGKITNKIKKTSLYVEGKTKKNIFESLIKKSDVLFFEDININNNWKNFINNLEKIKIKFKKKFFSEDILEINDDIIESCKKLLLDKYPELTSRNDDIKFYLINTKKNNAKGFYSEQQILESIYEFKNNNILEFNLKENDFIKFIFDSNMVILNNDEYDKKYKGLIYLNNDMFKYKEKNSYFVIKNKNETIGLLNFYSKDNDYIKKIGSISLDYRYRKSDLLYKIYNELHKLSLKNKFIITNDNYTNQGRLNIPKIKKDLNQNGMVFFDTTHNNYNTDLELKFNRYFIEKIELLNKNNYLKNYNKNILIYNKGIKKIKNLDSNNISYNEERKLLENLTKNINNNKIENDI